MKALLTLVVLGLFNFGSAFAQLSTDPSVQLDSAAGPATHLMKHAVFVCPDTTYEMTYEPLGEFNGLQFYREWLGPEHFRWQGMGRAAIKSDTVSPLIVFRAELLPGVDTIRSLFPSQTYGPPITRESGDMRIEVDALTADAFLSFGLNAFGLASLDTATAYYWGQVYEESKGAEKHYVLCEIEGWRKPASLFRYTVGRSVPQGFEVIEADTLSVPSKEMDRLKRKLETFVGAEWESSVCSPEGESHLLLVSGRKVVMAEHCWDFKKWNRRPEAISGIPWLYWKYNQPPRDFLGFPKNK